MKVYWIDLFCGAGGTSTGIHFSNTNSVVLACVNHDTNAIKSHLENHPDAHHFTEDIRDFNVIKKLKKIVNQLRIKEPNCIINLWASLECTNFSNAKGGQSRNADSRSLAEFMPIYLEAIKPDYFFVENVREFLDWGPLRIKGISKELYSELFIDKKGKYIMVPIKEEKGNFYNPWVNKIKKLGYNYDYKILNSANYGAYQTRKRLFIQFSNHNLPIDWPEITHTENDSFNSLFPTKKWNPVKLVLDLDEEGESIFTRKKPLVDNTLKEIFKGIQKAIKEEQSGFLFKYYGNGDNLNSFLKPAGTVTTKDRFAKIQLIFNQYKTGNTSSINKPLGTVTTTPKANLVSFIMNPSHGGHTNSINKTSPVIIARQDKAPLYLIMALMNDQGIIDIKLRMLKIDELKQIQGFPKDYKLIGNQTEQKKFIGNAVEVNQAKALVKSNYHSLYKKYKHEKNRINTN